MSKKWLIEKYRNDLIELQNSDDEEVAHIKADDILCSVLNIVGFSEIVDEYNEIAKYYA